MSNEQIAINDDTARFMKFMQISGSCTEEQAKEFLSDNQLKLFKSNGMLSSTNVTLKRGTLRQLHEEGAISQSTLDRELKSQIPSVVVFTTTPKCRRFGDKKFDIKDMHSSNTKVHDLKLASKFMSLNEEERASAIPESEVRRELRVKLAEFKEQSPDGYDEMKKRYEEELKGFSDRFEKEGGTGSPVDFAYRPSGSDSYTGYEAITKSYSNYEITVKEFGAEVMGYDYEEGRI